jgi:hypothetical protein
VTGVPDGTGVLDGTTVALSDGAGVVVSDGTTVALSDGTGVLVSVGTTVAVSLGTTVAVSLGTTVAVASADAPWIPTTSTAPASAPAMVRRTLWWITCSILLPGNDRRAPGRRP